MRVKPRVSAIKLSATEPTVLPKMVPTIFYKKYSVSAFSCACACHSRAAHLHSVSLFSRHICYGRVIRKNIRVGTLFLEIYSFTSTTYRKKNYGSFSSQLTHVYLSCILVICAIAQITEYYIIMGYHPFFIPLSDR